MRSFAFDAARAQVDYSSMKKLILASIVLAFAVTAQAGTEKAAPAKACCKQDTAACCLKAGDQAKAGCCAAKNVAAKKVQSPKAKTLASK